MRLRTLLAVLFLSAQLGAMVYARLSPRRYFCWTPNDSIDQFQLHVNVNGRELPQPEVWRRYQIETRHQGSVEYPIVQLIDQIRQYETTYGRSDNARVWLNWRHNGRPQLKQWQWPQQ